MVANTEKHSELLVDRSDVALDSDYTLIRVPVRHIPDVWSYVMPMVLKGSAVNPNMTLDQLTDGLLDQSIQMWLVMIGVSGKREVAAVFFTSIERDKGEWVLSLYGLGGKDARKWVMECHQEMHEFARQEDCKRVRMCGRPAWQRILPGYQVVGEKQGHLIYERTVD